MTMREADRLKTIQAVTDRMLRVGQAAQRLGMSRRQIERLVDRYLEDGPSGLVSRKRGRPSNNQLAPGIAERAITLICDRYADFGPTLAAEKLRECHGVVLSKETVRALMVAAGLWTPRKQRAAKIHQPRNRRACLGELIQIDGSDHAWFEDRAPACTLLVFIDDATSRLMQLHFVPTESSFAYFEATRAYLEQHGKPVAFYSDKAGIFRTVRESSDFGRSATQFGRVLFELNIEILCANSSQAKGRVERANLTLQDRLVKELRLREISTREAANAFAPHFMADFNGRFAKAPLRDFDAHRPVRSDEDLDLIFTWRLQRKVSLSLTLQYERVIYLLKDSPANRELIHRYIDVYE
ncbi:ISNCY family transposase, partial [Variovorax saccharolyticus]